MCSQQPTANRHQAPWTCLPLPCLAAARPSLCVATTTTATTIHNNQHHHLHQHQHHHNVPTHPTQNSALTATTAQVTTCLWMLSSPSRTACPKIHPPTVGDPSVEAASFLSNRTQVASLSRLGTYPISLLPSPPANALALQPGPLACRLVCFTNWALSTTALGSLASDSFKCAKCGNRVNVRRSHLNILA